MFDPELKSCEGPSEDCHKKCPHAIIYYGGDPFLSVARGLVLIERQSDDDDLIKKEGERDDDDDDENRDEDAFGGVGKKNDSCGRRWHLEVTPTCLRTYRV